MNPLNKITGGGAASPTSLFQNVIQRAGDEIKKKAQEAANSLKIYPCSDEITDYVNANTPKISQALGEPGVGNIQIGLVNQDNVIDLQFRIINDSRPEKNEEEYMQIQTNGLVPPKLILSGNYPRELNLLFSKINGTNFTNSVSGYTINEKFTCERANQIPPTTNSEGIKNYLDSPLTCSCSKSEKYKTINPYDVDPTRVFTYYVVDSDPTRISSLIV